MVQGESFSNNQHNIKNTTLDTIKSERRNQEKQTKGARYQDNRARRGNGRGSDQDNRAGGGMGGGMGGEWAANHVIKRLGYCLSDVCVGYPAIVDKGTIYDSTQHKLLTTPLCICEQPSKEAPYVTCTEA